MSPDVQVLVKPYRKTSRALLDPPVLIIEILSPDDRAMDVFDRFRDYASAGVVHVVLMDPEAFATYVFADGSLIRRELTGFEIPERGFLSFDSREILAQLEEELR